jgi:Predicted nucleoside-diphosphate sugar epimerases
VLFAVAYQCAYLLRWDASLPAEQYALFRDTLAIAITAKLVAFGIMGVYRGTWHHAGLSDVLRLAKATSVGMLLTVALTVFVFREGVFARTIFVMDGLLTLTLTIGARVSFRSLDLMRLAMRQEGLPTLIYGAGAAGEFAAREIHANPALGLRIVGYVDDDPTKLRRLLHGYPILGSHEALEGLVASHGIRIVLLAMRVLSPDRVAELEQRCIALDVDLRRMQLELVPLTPPTGHHNVGTGERILVAGGTL